MANAPGVMYKMKPFYGPYVIEKLPDNMFKMKNLHQSAEIHPPTTDEDDPVVALEKRQDSILQRLGQLQSMVNDLNTKYQVQSQVQSITATASSPSVASSSVASTGASSKLPIMNGVLHDIVVNLDPAATPANLVMTLYHLMKSKYRVLPKAFVHSSAVNVPEELASIFQDVEQNGKREDYQVVLNVVWKSGKGVPSLVVNPAQQVPILDTVNVVRYLMRLVQPGYLANPATATEVDEWLDLAQNSIITGNNRKQSSAMKTLNSRLGKNKWLVGNNLTMADVLIASYLHQTSCAADAPANVKKWLKSCDNLSAEGLAKAILLSS